MTCTDTNAPPTAVSCTSGCGCNYCSQGGVQVQCPSTCTTPCPAQICRNAAGFQVSCSSGCGCTTCFTGDPNNPALDGQATTCNQSPCSTACGGACGPVHAVSGWTLGGPINRFQSSSVPRFLLQATSTPPAGYSIADYADFYLASGPTQHTYTGLVPLYVCASYISTDCTCNGTGPLDANGHPSNYGAMGYLSTVKSNASMLRLLQVNNPTNNDKTWVTEDKLANYSYIGFTVVGTSLGYVWTGSAP
jgi:hypothetical protein